MIKYLITNTNTNTLVKFFVIYESRIIDLTDM